MRTVVFDDRAAHRGLGRADSRATVGCDRLLTADELASRLRRSRDWVYRRARAGELPGALRLDEGWRFREAEVEAWLRARQQPKPPAELEQTPPARRATPAGTKITIKPRSQGRGGLEANLFWTDAEGKRRRLRRASPFASKAKTRRWAEAILRELVGEPEDDGLPDEPSFAEFAPRFLEFCASAAAGRRGPNSEGELDNKRSIITHHLEPFFGATKLSAINLREIDAYVCKKAREPSPRTGKPLSPSTISNHLGLLKRMLEVALRWELIAKAPKIELPKKRVVDNYLDRDESRTLLEHVDPLFRDFILVALRTGLRLGELRELRVGDLQLDAGRIRVTRQRTKKDEVTPPKGGKARTVLVPSDAVTVLRRRVSGLASDALVFCKPTGYRAPGSQHSPAKGGEPWSHKDAYGEVRRGAESAGIARRIGVHTLRHSFATQAVAAGVPLPVVSRQLGHADVRTTMRYAHHAPELTPGIFERLAEGEVLDRIDGSLEPLRSWASEATGDARLGKS